MSLVQLLAFTLEMTKLLSNSTFIFTILITAEYLKYIVTKSGKLGNRESGITGIFCRENSQNDRLGAFGNQGK